MSTNPPNVTVAYVASLIGGIIILVFSLLSLVWFGSGAPSWGGFGDALTSLMGGYHDFLGDYGGTGFFTAVSMASFVCGVIVIFSSLVLRMHPEEHRMWGVVIVVFSAVSFVGMGGFFIGAGFGILGGVLALRYRPLT
jgi:hypothetical protein